MNTDKADQEGKPRLGRSGEKNINQPRINEDNADQMKQIVRKPFYFDP